MHAYVAVTCEWPQVEGRLGTASGIDELKAHPFLKRIDWDALEAGTLPRPYVPALQGDADVRYFDSRWTSQPAHLLSAFARLAPVEPKPTQLKPTPTPTPTPPPPAPPRPAATPAQPAPPSSWAAIAASPKKRDQRALTSPSWGDGPGRTSRSPSVDGSGALPACPVNGAALGEPTAPGREAGTSATAAEAAALLPSRFNFVSPAWR